MSMPAPPVPPPTERRRTPRRRRRAIRAAIGLLVLSAIALVGYFSLWRVEAPQLYSVTPAVARAGGVITLEGKRFEPTLEGNVVYFNFDVGRVVEATPRQLKVEVPQMDLWDAKGAPRQVRVRVQVGERETEPVEMVVEPPSEPEPGSQPNADDENDQRPAAPTPAPRGTTR